MKFVLHRIDPYLSRMQYLILQNDYNFEQSLTSRMRKTDKNI